MKFRQQEITQSISAAKADIRERSGRRIEKNLPSQLSSARLRTRKDPFKSFGQKCVNPC